MNGIQVTNFHNRSTEPLNYYRIYARPQAINPARRPEFYKYIDRLVNKHLIVILLSSYFYVVFIVFRFVFLCCARIPQESNYIH